MLIGGVCMGKRAAISTVAIVHPIKQAGKKNYLKVSFLGSAARVRGYPGFLGGYLSAS